jgi:hypothetical protein
MDADENGWAGGAGLFIAAKQLRMERRIFAPPAPLCGQAHGGFLDEN